VIGQAYVRDIPAIYFVQNASNKRSRLQVTPSWPLVAPQSLFPRLPFMHRTYTLSFTGCGEQPHCRGAAKSRRLEFECLKVKFTCLLWCCSQTDGYSGCLLRFLDHTHFDTHAHTAGLLRMNDQIVA